MGFRIRRRLKIFVSCSYSKSDEEIVRRLIQWLEHNNVEVKFAKRETRPGSQLPLAIIGLIEESHCVFAAGTKGFMSSDWCEQEVDYAKTHGKKYIPILCEKIPEQEIKKWFKGIIRSCDGEVVYADCSDGNFDTLKPVLQDLISEVCHFSYGRLSCSGSFSFLEHPLWSVSLSTSKSVRLEEV